MLCGDRVGVVVHEGPVGRALVDQGPVTGWLAHQHGVAVGDADVLEGAREIKVRLNPLLHAPATDPDLVSQEGDATPLALLREVKALRLHALEPASICPDGEGPALLLPERDAVRRADLEAAVAAGRGS